MAAEAFLNKHIELVPQHLLQIDKTPVSEQTYWEPRKVNNFVTFPMLKQIMPNIPMAELHSDLINTLAPKYGLDNKEVFPEFIAQVAHESSEFRKKEESLYYSAKRLREVFPKYFPTDELAKSYAYNSQKIGNRVYANRMGNGPESSGDGYKNRGGGYIMLTGDIWQLYARYIGKTVEETQMLVRSSSMIEYALDSAMWFFSIYKSLNDEAARNEFRKITIAINGGTNGAADREIYYRRALKVFN